jgi:hypothetical protein
MVAPSLVTVTSPTSSTSICGRAAGGGGGGRVSAARARGSRTLLPRRARTAAWRTRVTRVPPAHALHWRRSARSASAAAKETVCCASLPFRLLTGPAAAAVAAPGARLVQADGAQRALHDVRDGRARIHCAAARRRAKSSVPCSPVRAW